MSVELPPELARRVAELAARASQSPEFVLREAVAAYGQPVLDWVLARIEGGVVSPSTVVLERLARATGTRLRITFEPQRKRATKARKAS